MTRETFEITTWSAVKEKALRLNPGIASEIDKIPGVDQFKVILARYKFGDPIIDKGQFNIRINDKIVPFYGKDTPKEALEMMEYKWAAIPVGFVTKNSMESHIDHSSHIVPFVLQKTGHVFSALSLFDESPFSNLIPEMRSTRAGCRSLLMLSKLTLKAGNKNLHDTYGINQNLYPNNYTEHWKLFYELSNSPAFQTDWYCEVLLFSKDFLYPEEARLGLRHMLLQSIWTLVSFRREEMIFNLIWSSFEKKLPLSIKNPVFFTETTKQIIKIALQESPAYSPADTDNSGPISEFSNIIANDYKILDGFPVFMCLDKYNLIDPIYYSLNKHSFPREMPKKIANSGKAAEIVGVKRIFDAFQKYILNDECEHPLQRSLLYHMLSTTEFDFYHPQARENDINKNILELAEQDVRFFQFFNKGTYKKPLNFPKTAQFFHGCVRIRPKT